MKGLPLKVKGIETRLKIDVVSLIRFVRKPIQKRGGKIHFGKIKFPEDQKTNFKVTKSNDADPDFYDLETLHFFAEQR